MTPNTWQALTTYVIILTRTAMNVRGRKDMDQTELRKRVDELERQGITNRTEQASELGISRPTLMRRLRDAGLTRQGRLSHREWIPWKVRAEHNGGVEMVNLRALSTAVQRPQTDRRYRLKSALNWARSHLQGQMDITYDPEHGFRAVPADPENWRLMDLYNAALAALATLPPLDDN